uniref:Uncharacterized protein n=1 Tax=Tanacetum cinerariifolium TaxID=118510 RepID=A0A699H8D5_TANCI|nr:hypothetical protein [Tanacetum cinerariifolium]
MLMDFDDVQDVSDEEIESVMKGKGKVDEDLCKPIKEVLKCPFTRRIVKFSSPGHRMPANAKIYDGTGDPKDHVGRFIGMGNQGQWPMPGFAAALAVLITGASQSRQHGKSEQSEVSSVASPTNKLFEAPHHPSFLQLLVNRLDHDFSSFLFQCTPSSLWQGVNINESLRVLIWSVWIIFSDVGSGSFWLGDIDFLLKTNAKLGSANGGFVALVVGGGVGVDCGGEGVKDCNDCGMAVEYKVKNQ